MNSASAPECPTGGGGTRSGRCRGQGRYRPEPGHRAAPATAAGGAATASGARPAKGAGGRLVQRGRVTGAAWRYPFRFVMNDLRFMSSGDVYDACGIILKTNVCDWMHQGV